MKKLVVMFVVLCLLCMAACSAQPEEPLQDDRVQAFLDTLRAIPAEELEFVLFNPIPVEGQQYALATESLVEEYLGYGYDVVTRADDSHRAAVRTLLESLALERVESGKDLRSDSGGGNRLRVFHNGAPLGGVTVGDLRATWFRREEEQDWLFCFSMDTEAARTLLSAIGRDY